MKRLIATTVLSGFLWSAPNVEADRGVLGFSASGHNIGWWDPFIDCYGTSLCLTYIDVYVRSIDGLRGVSFAAPIPEGFGEIWAKEFNTWYTVVEGDFESGIVIDFEGCLTSTLNSNHRIVRDMDVGTITIISTGFPDCTPYFPWPRPESSTRRIEGINCNSETVILNHQGVTFDFDYSSCGGPSTPYGE